MLPAFFDRMCALCPHNPFAKIVFKLGIVQLVLTPVGIGIMQDAKAAGYIKQDTQGPVLASSPFMPVLPSGGAAAATDASPVMPSSVTIAVPDRALSKAGKGSAPFKALPSSSVKSPLTHDSSSESCSCH